MAHAKSSFNSGNSYLDSFKIQLVIPSTLHETFIINDCILTVYILNLIVIPVISRLIQDSTKVTSLIILPRRDKVSSSS